MQTNPYEDEMPLVWIPQENQFYERESDKIHSSQMSVPLQYQSGQRNMQYQKPKPEERMPKTQALELVNIYKKRLIVASLVVFGLVSGLVVFHQVGAAANQVSVDPSQSAPVTQPSNGGGYFDQQGGNKVQLQIEMQVDSSGQVTGVIQGIPVQGSPSNPNTPSTPTTQQV